MKTLLLTLALGVLLVLTVQSQHFKFMNRTTADGLSVNDVKCIFQDSKGFMWFGTRDGLNRYDGYKFTVYRNNPGDSTTIGSNNIKSMCEDKKGRLWFVTTKGLNCYDYHTAKFTHFKNKPGDKNSLPVNNLLFVSADEQDNLILGHLGGIIFFNTELKKFTNVKLYNQQKKEIKATCFAMGPKNNLWIGTINDGVLNLNLDKDTLLFFQRDSISKSMLNYTIKSLYHDRKGNVWIGTDFNGLYRYNSGSDQFTHYIHDPQNPGSLSSNEVIAIQEDADGKLWLGTQRDGLNVMDPSTGRFTHIKKDETNSLSLHNGVQCIFKDHKGTMWVGILGAGISFYDANQNQFRHYKYSPNDNSVSNNIIKAFTEDINGTIWISTDGGGLNEFNPHTGVFKAYRHDEKNKESISSDFTITVYKDKKENIWVSTSNNELNLFDRKKGTFKTFKIDPKDSTSLRSRVYSMREDQYGQFWVTSRGGIQLYNPVQQNFTFFAHPPVGSRDFSSDSFASLFEDSKGVLWVRTDNSLHQFDPRTRRFTYIHQDEDNPSHLSSTEVTKIFEDSRGNMWIGTEQGLNLLTDRNKFTFKQFGLESGFPNTFITNIIEDSQGNLWITHNKGLSCFNTTTYTTKNYDLRDGLQANEFRRNSAFRSSTGEIYLGGANGFNVFHPDSIEHNTFIPPVRITDFQLFNKSVPIGGEDSPLQRPITVTNELTLNHNQSVLHFEYVALNYVLSEKNQYAYKLEGFDQDWNYVGNQQKATYTNLDPGEYVFKVKASNNEGLWNETGTSIKVTITPPFWSTWWFRILVFSVVIGSSIGFYGMRISVVRRQKDELEKQVHVRTEQLVLATEEERKARQLAEKSGKEAEQANRAKSIFLATMSHEIRTPMNGVLGMASLLCETPLNAEQLEYSQTIRNCGESLLGVINDILDYSKIESGKMELESKDFDLRTTIEEVLDLFASKSTEAGLDLIYEIDHHVPAQIIGDSLRLRQVLMNLVSNAIKFTRQGEVFIGVQLARMEGEDVELRFEVRDTGIGIPEDKLHRLFKAFSQVDSSMTRQYGGTGLGLVICEKLIGLMGGQIAVTSQPGTGTTFTFTIKSAVSHKSIRSYVSESMTGLEGKRILVVDDNSTNRIILQNQLAQWKFNTTLATSGTEALIVLAKSAPFDLIVTDMHMPEMDGMELAKDIRGQYPATPIILLSSIGDDRCKAHPELFSSVLTKPVKQSLLSRHIAMHLQQQSELRIEEPQVSKKLYADFSQKYPLDILIAEDNPVNQKLSERVLAKLGYTADIAVNGKEALRALKENYYNLIFMDVQMPEMDGLEATRKIREQYDSQPVIIAMTANAMQGDREICLAAGMDDYISKPIKLEDLTAMLQKWSVQLRKSA